MTANKKRKKIEKREKEVNGRQSQVAYNRTVYNDLCEIIGIIYSTRDYEVLDLPWPILDNVSNSTLSVDYTRTLVKSAIEVLRIYVRASLHNSESFAREYSELRRRIQDQE